MRPSACFVHLLLGSEHDRLRRAGLGAGRPLTDGNAVGAERAFIRLVVDLRDARDVEWASLHAIAAADAVLVHEVDDAVRILHDRARRGQAFRQPGSSQCMQPSLRMSHSRLSAPGLTHSVKRISVNISGVRSGGFIVRRRKRRRSAGCGVVPFEACRLAGLAADAFRDVDQLGDRLDAAVPAAARSRQTSGRDRRSSAWAGRARPKRWEAEETSFASLQATGAGDGLDVDQKRLEFRRLDIGVADEGRQRIRAEALLGLRP